MLKSYQYQTLEYQKPADLDSATPRHYPVVVVGAGPVGLTSAIDLAAKGHPVLLLDNDHTVSIGSRGVCYAKRTLEVLDRMGCDNSFVAKGTSWDIGRTFFRNDEVFHFNLRPQMDHNRPGMINLQQYYLEEYLLKRARELPNLEMRFDNAVTAVEQQGDSVVLTVNTPDGDYTLSTDWLIAADGARSPIRTMLGLDIDGKVFMDRFLIADVVMKADYPAERWFWFDPPFHRNQSVLLHKQADNVWRIDFQLGWQADPEEEKKPENVIPRIRAMLGDEREFELEWVSVYTFQCRRMDTFTHGRVLFVGDAAHQVSPFGARGANSGIQDSDNLGWKLDLVMRGVAPATLLDSYSQERCFAADENIMNSTRSTDFITPKSTTSKTFRNAVLELANEFPFARALVNSGRLSVPTWLTTSNLNTVDQDSFTGNMLPGAPMDDAPVLFNGQTDWLLHHVGNQFTVLLYAEDTAHIEADTVQSLHNLPLPVTIIVVAQQGQPRNDCKVLLDHKQRLVERYDLQAGTTYLLRPDQHVAARWRQYDFAQVQAALQRAIGLTP